MNYVFTLIKIINLISETHMIQTLSINYYRAWLLYWAWCMLGLRFMRVRDSIPGNIYFDIWFFSAAKCVNDEECNYGTCSSSSNILERQCVCTWGFTGDTCTDRELTVNLFCFNSTYFIKISERIPAEPPCLDDKTWPQLQDSDFAV